MKKVLICIAIFLNVCIGISYSFTDTTGHWAESEITNFAENEYVNGYEDNTFRPNKSIKWNEYIKILVKTMTKSVTKGVNWYKPYVDFVIRNELLKDTKIDYEKSITRQEAILLLSKYIEFYDIKIEKSNLKNISFLDYDGKNYSINYMCNNGLLVGYIDKTLRLNSEITRAEAIKVILKTKKYIDENVYIMKNSMNVFNKENITQYTNYDRNNKVFKNVFLINNGKMKYTDTGRYSIYNGYVSEKYNQKICELVLELINKGNYVLNTYVEEENYILISYGEEEKYVDNGSTLFDIYLYNTEKQINNNSYTVKICIHKLWKELSEIKNGNSINKYYENKLARALRVLLNINKIEKVLEVLHNSSITEFKSDKLYIQKVSNNIYIFV